MFVHISSGHNSVFTKNFVKHRPDVIILQARTIFYWPKIFSANLISILSEKEDYLSLASVAIA
jgi:hypothetical protein